MSNQWNGVGKVNQENEIMTISDKSGSLLVQLESDVATTAITSSLSFRRSTAPNAPILTDQDTQRTAENTGYTGNTATLIFSGQALNNVHILPRSVVINPTAGGDTVDATDRDGDGILYTDDVDEDACGTINYSTGAIYLSYPAGKAPNTGVIAATYKSTGSCVAKGTKAYRINNVNKNESIKVYAIGSTMPVPMRVSVYGG